MGRHIDGFDGVHGEYGIGQRNLEEKMLLEFCLGKDLCVTNTWFKSFPYNPSRLCLFPSH